MGLRIFLGSDGVRWTAWTVRDDAAGATQWLAFQNETGTERRRLLETPPDWETISDKRLDLLCRMADPVPRYLDKHSLPDGMGTVVSKRKH